MRPGGPAAALLWPRPISSPPRPEQACTTLHAVLCRFYILRLEGSSRNSSHPHAQVSPVHASSLWVPA